MSSNLETELLAILKQRFEKNMQRHEGIAWSEVEVKLSAHSQKLLALNDMERTGGEPDVVGFDEATGEYIFCDCSPESPDGRRSICYDRKALDARKEHKPVDSALDMAAMMGVTLLDEEQYRALQKLGEFDKKTSSWIQTPTAMRELGGALFCDRRYDQVFTYHNGAQSYYSGRGFRAYLKV
ncbi:DUF4256 domain-containing protein [Undibacterium danionis]|uniref:DUF4256 domain-containing protein n=1 Tax=Undibacterium danionis TaxID=1812100 RepID=A0ABV6IDL0_9BURK